MAAYGVHRHPRPRLFVCRALLRFQQRRGDRTADEESLISTGADYLANRTLS